jgi:hypothetical protein
VAHQSRRFVAIGVLQIVPEFTREYPLVLGSSSVCVGPFSWLSMLKIAFSLSMSKLVAKSALGSALA